MPSLSELYSASDEDPAPIVDFLRELASSYGLPQPLRALDAGCGPGRLLLPLERLRWQVTGIEPNPDFAASARVLASSSRRVTVLQQGFLDIAERETFDLVLAINSSFAHLLRPADRSEALRRIFRSLRPGGVVCLDVPNFIWILENFRAPEPYTFTTQGRPVTLRRRHEIDYHSATFTTVDEYRSTESGHLDAQLVHTYGMAAFPEFEYHLGEHGFTDLRTYAGYASRADERLTGARMLISARRPAA